MTYKIKGPIKHIGEVQQITEKFKKREFVISLASGSYTQYITLQCLQDNCSMLDELKIGDIVEAEFVIHGKEAKNGKFYNSMNITNITFIEHPEEVKEEENWMEQNISNDGTTLTRTEAPDDLPF